MDFNENEEDTFDLTVLSSNRDVNNQRYRPQDGPRDDGGVCLASSLPLEIIAEISRHLQPGSIFRLIFCCRSLSRVVNDDRWWLYLIMYHWSVEWAREFVPQVLDEPDPNPPGSFVDSTGPWMPWKMRYRYFAQHLRWLRPYRRALQMDPRVQRVFILSDHEAIRADALASALRRNTSLNDLGLGRCNLTDRDLTLLAESLVENHTLRQLSIEKNRRITPKGLAPLAEALISNSTLARLDLMDVRIGNEGCEALGEMLKHNTAITSLLCGGGRIADHGARALAAGLELNGTLRWLYLSRNPGMGDDGVIALADALRNNDALQTLHLANVGLANRGLLALCTALHDNSTLRHLDVSGNDLELDCARTICRCIGWQPVNLRKLWCSENLFSSAAKKDLRAEVRRSNPNLEFFC